MPGYDIGKIREDLRRPQAKTESEIDDRRREGSIRKMPVRIEPGVVQGPRTLIVSISCRAADALPWHGELAEDSPNSHDSNTKSQS